MQFYNCPIGNYNYRPPEAGDSWNFGAVVLQNQGGGCATGMAQGHFEYGLMPGRGARIPRAVLAGEAGLLGG